MLRLTGRARHSLYNKIGVGMGARPDHLSPAEHTLRTILRRHARIAARLVQGVARGFVLEFGHCAAPLSRCRRSRFTPLARTYGPHCPTQAGTLTSVRQRSYVHSGRADSNRRRPAWEAENDKSQPIATSALTSTEDALLPTSLPSLVQKGPQLAAVVEAWCTLSEQDRATILAIVQASQQGQSANGCK